MKPRGRRNKIGGQFSAKLIEMLESAAWRVLSLSARRLIERIEIEFAHHGGNDNGALPVTYADFLAYGLGDRNSIAAARREAVALGFVRFTPGRGGNREFRCPDRFGVTFAPCDATHEWRKIKTLDEAKAIAEAARMAKDPRAVAIGRARANRRVKKQEPSPEKPPVSVWKSQTETPETPVRENHTTGSVGKTRPLSIFGDGARSAPVRGAEASAPSSKSSSSVEEVVVLIMGAVGCSREEAIKLLAAIPETGVARVESAARPQDKQLAEW